MTRVADDFIIERLTPEAAEEALVRIQEWKEAAGRALPPEKCRIAGGPGEFPGRKSQVFTKPPLILAPGSLFPRASDLIWDHPDAVLSFFGRQGWRGPQEGVGTRFLDVGATVRPVHGGWGPEGALRARSGQARRHVGQQVHGGALRRHPEVLRTGP